MIKNLIKKFLTNTGPGLHFKNTDSKNRPILTNISLHSFGVNNPNKIFYVIRRSPGAGFFSNLTYVLGHLKIAENHKLIPVVDMENFPTIYNEKKSIHKSKNSWEYYFEQVSNYDLKEIYKSKNVILTSNIFENHVPTDMSLNNIFKKTINKYIKIKKNIKNEIIFFKKKYFMGSKKILGVHFRGTTYKTARGHAFPLPKNTMKKNIDVLIKKFNYEKIFVVTEEKEYLKFLKKHYGNKIISLNVFRSSNQDAFKHYPRLNHRYRLGREIMIEALLLSLCDGITYVRSNVSSAAIAFSKKKIRLHPLLIGYNSRNKYISRWYWYIKKFLPGWMGGFKINYKY